MPGPGGGNRPHRNVSPPPEARRGVEGARLQTAAQVPGYGGDWWDEAGNLHVALVDTSNASAVRALLLPRVQQRAPGMITRPGGPRAVIVHQSRYTFEQLLQWRDIARQVVPQFPEFATLGYDLKANQVDVLITSVAASERILDALEDAGVPRNAVRFRVGPRARRGATLRDRRDTIEGGLKITTRGGSVPWGGTMARQWCSIGLTAISDAGNLVLVTNSHCTGTRGRVDGTRVYQADSGAAGRQIAIESRDPPWRLYPQETYCPQAPNAMGRNYQCRWSDAILADYVYAPATYWPLGRIARPECYRTGAGIAGCLKIDPVFPYFPAQDKQSFASVGDVVQKVGSWTGWTNGQVVRECQDVEDGDFYLICQQEVQGAYYDVGDSGGPAFLLPGTPSPDWAVVVGITSHFWSTDTFFFAPMDWVEAELGVITLW
jgi:hypothetical protein